MGHIVMIVAGTWLVLDGLVVVFLYLEKSRRPAAAQPQADSPKALPDDGAITREREAMLTVARERARFRQHREEAASSRPLALSPHAGRSRPVRQG